MLTLGMLPSVRIGTPKKLSVTCALSDAPAFHPGWGLRDLPFADEKALLAIEEDVAIHPEALHFEIDEPLLRSDTVIAYPARSRVSGSFSCPGIWLVTQAAAQAMPETTVGAFRAEITVPRCIGTFFGHATPEEAFASAFSLARSPRVFSDHEPLDYSVGADALNGDWWLLGGFAGLLGQEGLAHSWTRHAPLMRQPDVLARTLQSEARHLRTVRGIPVRALPADASRIARCARSNWPGPKMWAAFEKACPRLGNDHETLSARYRAASAFAVLS